MRRKTISSSVIQSAGYDPATSTLELKFQETGLYRYFNVPEIIFETLLTAPSKGHYFDRYIRDHYSYEKLS